MTHVNPPAPPAQAPAADPAAPPAQGWRGTLKVHPAADGFPPMSEKELKELAGDIKRNGMKMPIILWAPEEGPEFQLLDGRNRLDALHLLGALEVTPCGAMVFDERIVAVEGDGVSRIIGGDPVKLAYSLNVHRRHLTAEVKRDLIAALLKADPKKSNRQVAEKAGVSHPHVAKVRDEMEKAGDVETVTTSIDTKGREQPAKRKPSISADGNGADPEASAAAMKAKLAETGHGAPADEPVCEQAEPLDLAWADADLEARRHLLDGLDTSDLTGALWRRVTAVKDDDNRKTCIEVFKGINRLLTGLSLEPRADDHEPVVEGARGAARNERSRGPARHRERRGPVPGAPAPPARNERQRAMKRARNLRLALELLGQSGLVVDTVVEGARHTVVRLVDGRRVIVSRGDGSGEHGAFLVRRDVGRLVRAGARP
jgi:DNA-binding Lrp family transcriptional regulator